MRRTTQLAAASTLLATLLALGGVAAQAADTASGFLLRNGERAKLTSVCALEAPGAQVFPNEATYRILFAADRPIDCPAASNSYNPVKALRVQMAQKKGSYLLLMIPGKLQEAHAKRATPQIDNGYPAGFPLAQDLKLAQAPAGRIAGSARSQGQQDQLGERYEYELKFDATVLRGPLEGEPLAAGGGEPGKALQQALKAIAAKDAAGKKQTIAADKLEEYDDDLPAQLRELQLKQATVKGGRQRGDQAALEVVGKTFNGSAAKGLVLMRKEGGQWKLADDLLHVDLK